ncbi:MAG: glycosyl transferase family 1 [Blastopirellula sp.]|nr:MAG: glycosyl transferase family 1 [Blastopirellula sp.]
MIKILLIIPTLDQSGAEKQLALLASRLPKDQFEVHVCALTRSGPYEDVLREAGIPVTVIGKSWKADPFAYWRLRKFIQQLKPDIVHTWLFAANSYGRKAALAAKVPHIICGERCVDPWKAGYELFIDRYLDRSTDKIAVNSSGIQDFYVHKKRDANKFVVIPNGIEAPELPSPDVLSVRKKALLEELGLPLDSRLLCTVGRLWPQKNMKDIIWAMDIMQRVRDDTHLLIIGEGPQRWRLERFAQQANVGPRVHFLGHRDDVRELLPLTDCFLLASGYEGQSNALMEAMAAGLPAVVSDIPGNRDLVIHEETGFTVPVGHRAEYGRLANKILEDDQLRSKFGTNARQRILDHFTIDQMIQGHVDLYQQVMSK